MSRQASLAVVLFIGLVALLTPAAWSQTVVWDFPAPVATPAWVEGLAYGSGSLWFSNAWEIHRINPDTGGTVYKLNVTGYINDIEYVSGDLWLARVDPPSLVRVDRNTGAELQVIDTSAQGYPEGLCWDGRRLLFTVDGPPPQLYEANPATGVIALVGDSAVADPEALAYGDGFLWAGGKADPSIHKLDAQTGEEITSFAAPASDTHGLAWDGYYLWSSSYSTMMIYQIDVTNVNVPPVLTYPQTTGYKTDGVNPDSGTTSTNFDFQVVYTDADNDWPYAVWLHILRNGVETSGSPFFMNETGNYNYRQGVVFDLTKTVSEGMDYSYYFSAVNWYHSAVGPATDVIDGPWVSNQPPVLSWTGEPGYVGDGVNPDIGQPSTTEFVYHVLYTGTVAADFVNLHILKNGVPILHSPFRMTTDDTTPYKGAIYTCTKTLQRSRGYTYYCEASDGLQAAGGVPTSPLSGPIVGNQAPSLAWTGQPGYEDSGVTPQIGTPHDTFAYRVEYSDPDGDMPSYVRLHLLNGRKEIAGSPFTLAAVAGSKPKEGITYGTGLSLALGRRYAYWFEASDGYEAAAGGPTTEAEGPIVDSPPQLEWLSTGRYRDSGVAPKRGAAPLVCQFRVRYRDLEGDHPRFIKVHVQLDGEPIAGSPFRCVLIERGRVKTGQIWGCQVTLATPGRYSYHFAGRDLYSTAEGVPTEWQSGPRVLEAGPAALTALAATPGRAGVAVTLSLSSAAKVDAQVLNLAGRPIRNLAAGQACPSGITTLVWDGRAATGLTVPAGTYVIAVTARDATGGQSRALAQVVLQR